MMPDTSPTHVAITMQLANELLNYLDSKPRGESNLLATAIEQSITINIKQEEKVEEPTEK